MPTTFSQFKEEVLALYEAKKKRHELDDLLANPSPANLRDYCLVRLSEQLASTDIDIFQKFFDPYKKEKNLEEAIFNFNPGFLKASQKFIQGKTENPDDLLVKLIAILVDYQPRPFQYSYDLTTGKPGSPPTGGPGNPPTGGPGSPPTGGPGNSPTGGPGSPPTGGPGNSPTGGPGSPPTGGRLMGFYKNNMIALRFSTVSGLIIIIFYIIYCLTPKGCMYWDGHRYVETTCQSSVPYHRVIGFNNNQFHSFFKIMRPDTLSKKDVGFVWYSKIDNEVEFFTGPGFHPIETKKGLKLATEYIIETYAGVNAKIDQNKRLSITGK
ncbi:hypothetical protein [Sphingobacterium sp. 40-24]|uniref:hypothetical protein n=1 Tax=Sphingobacterium sp. 40-24 TaxID=1895843 RepID=UPI0009651C1C|nr:hypothetical protein [Sphingobacterium sp. 40-24]OJZ15141.1 MAG: hypothetical protein BGP15_23745 [Sphingobacterium sp. 40-24]